MRRSAGGRSEEVERASRFTGCNAIIDIELAVNALHLRANIIDGDKQFSGDLRVGAASS